MSLCQSGIIPEEFHVYYAEMQSSKSLKDKLPAPDASEEDVHVDTDSG